MRVNPFIFQIILLLIISCNTNKTMDQVSNQVSSYATKKAKKSIAQTLQQQEHLPIKEQIALYRKLKKEKPTDYNFENEDEMTMYGYRQLWNNQLNEALEVFKLIVEEFPESSNPYDSLGEAYLAVGDTILALENYQKSLALNPDNFNAEDQISLIKYPNKKPISLKEKFFKTYNKQAYIEDLDQLGNKLLKIHPNALKFISEKQFWKTIEAKKNLITPTTTFAEFAWHCSEIIANINCSHTDMGSFRFENEMLPNALKFPLQTRLIENKLYVTNAYTNNNNVSTKDEIISINGIPTSQLVEESFKHIVSQGYIKTAKRQTFNSWSSVIIPYALNLPKEYTVQIKGKQQPIALKPANNIEMPFRDNSVPYCGNELCFTINEQKHTAIMTIRSFNYYPWNNLDQFEQFIDDSFKKIKDRQVKNLIIDLRFNGGGSPESSIYLLKYLVKTPFAYFSKNNNSKGYGLQQPFLNRFKGKLFFLIDGQGESTTGHFMALAKELNLGTIIGEELGSNQFCTAGQTVLRLSNSKLVYYVANTTSKLANVTLSDERGILPDYTIIQNIDDHLNKEDTVKKFAFKLIDKQN